MFDLDDMSMHETKCLVYKKEDSWLWHKCLSHVHFNLLNKISSKNLVVGLPKIKFLKDKLCYAFQTGKQTRVSFKLKKVILTSKPLELLHLDLFVPLQTRSLEGNYYKFVIASDYSRFTWTLFLSIRMILLKFLLTLLRLFKMFLVLKSPLSIVIMVGNSLIIIFKTFASKMVLLTIFHV